MLPSVSRFVALSLPNIDSASTVETFVSYFLNEVCFWNCVGYYWLRTYDITDILFDSVCLRLCMMIFPLLIAV